MNAIVKILAISLIIILPMIVIRIFDIELNVNNISDTGAIALLIVPLLIIITLKWLFEPRKKSHKSNLGSNDIFIKFQK